VAQVSGGDNMTQPDRALSQADTQEATAKATVEQKVVRKVKKTPLVKHALSQSIMSKYIVPLKVAQEGEKTEIAAAAQKTNHTKASKVRKVQQHERRKLFPAAMHSLASLMTNTQRGIDADVFDGVIETVRDIIRTEASATTTDIEASLQTMVDTMAACATDNEYSSGSSDGTSAAYDTEDSAYTTAVGEYDTAYASENATCTEKNTVCDNRDAKGLELYNEVTGSQSCGLPEAADATVLYDDTFVLADVDTWAQTLLAKHTSWDTAKVECTTKEQECAAAETVTAEKETTKTEKCTSLAGATTTGASGYDDCWNTANGAYQAYDSSTILTSIQTSIEAVETLMCYIEVAMEGIAKDERSIDTDASMACTFDAANESYDCVCTDGEGTDRYTETYDLTVNWPDAPSEDTSWDDLGCPDAPTTTSATTEVY